MKELNLKELLVTAQQNRMAIGAFNIFNELTARAAVKAAQSLNCPIILQTSVSTVKQYGPKGLIQMLKPLKHEAGIPVVIHLAHCTDPELAIRCAEAGWDSVMIDASHEPIEENIRITRLVKDSVRELGVSVEGEIGVISGVENDIVATVAVPAGIEDTLRYAAETGIDALAPAIGTAHGVYHGDPVINFDLVEELKAQTNCPIVIHGGTGLSAETFGRLIELGAAKINVSTAIKQSYLKAARQYLLDHPDADNPLKMDQAIEASVMSTVRKHLIQFGAVRSPWNQTESGRSRENELKALIFDCDGVLAETERDGHRIAFNRAFQTSGLPIEWDNETYGRLLKIGGGKERMRAYFKEHAGSLPADCRDEEFVRELHALKSRYYMAMSEAGELPVREGILRLFDEAASNGLVLCVCSTSSEQSVRTLIRAIMGEERLNRFDAIFAGDMVRKKKPAPDIYQLVLDRFGLAGQQCCVVEDSDIGLQAAKAAGMNCVVTISDYTGQDDFTDADLIVSSLGDPTQAPIKILQAKKVLAPAPAMISLADLAEILR